MRSRMSKGDACALPRGMEFRWSALALAASPKLSCHCGAKQRAAAEQSAAAGYPGTATAVSGRQPSRDRCAAETTHSRLDRHRPDPLHSCRSTQIAGHLLRVGLDQSRAGSRRREADVDSSPVASHTHLGSYTRWSYKKRRTLVARIRSQSECAGLTMTLSSSSMITEGTDGDHVAEVQGDLDTLADQLPLEPQRAGARTRGLRQFAVDMVELREGHLTTPRHLHRLIPWGPNDRVAKVEDGSRYPRRKRNSSRSRNSSSTGKNFHHTKEWPECCAP